MIGMIPLALRNWKLVVTAIVIAALSLMLVLAKADARQAHKVADRNAALFQLETAKHAVTRASLNVALTSITDQSDRAKALAAESAARTEASTKRRLAAELAAQAGERTAAALDASGAKPRSGVPCAPSDVFWNQSRKEL